MKVPLLRPSWHTGTTTVSTAYIQRVSQLRFGGERFLKIIRAFPQFFAPLTFDSEVISVKIHIWMWGLCDIDVFFFLETEVRLQPCLPNQLNCEFLGEGAESFSSWYFWVQQFYTFPTFTLLLGPVQWPKDCNTFFFASVHQCTVAERKFSICRDLPCLPFLRDWLSQYREERNRKNSLGDKLEFFSLRNLENVIWFPVSFSLDDFLLLCCQLRQSW